MKTKNEVIEFVKNELESNNTLVVSTMGNGGAGLTYVQFGDVAIESFIEDLNFWYPNFDGLVSFGDFPDIENDKFYNSDCDVYQLSGLNGGYIQIMTY